jgi:hypothetical protein
MGRIKYYQKMAAITTDLSIVTLNANGLDSPIKRHRLIDCIQKHLADKDKHKLKVKEWKSFSK